MNHTPEPWEAEFSATAGNMVLIGKGLKRVQLGGPPGDPNADMQRIVACVNALANRNPAALAALEAALEKALATRERLPGAQGGEGCNGAYRILHLGDLQAALAAFRWQA